MTQPTDHDHPNPMMHFAWKDFIKGKAFECPAKENENIFEAGWNAAIERFYLMLDATFPKPEGING